MKGMVRKTDLNALIGGGAKVKAAPKTRRRGVAVAEAYSAMTGSGKAYRKCRGDEFTDDDGLPEAVTDSILELDGIIDRLFSHAAEDEDDMDAIYNASYFDACRAHDLISGINHRLNRITAGDKKAVKPDASKNRRIDSLYGVTAILEKDLKSFMDSMEREYGLDRNGLTDSCDAPVMAPRTEDI